MSLYSCFQSRHWLFVLYSTIALGYVLGPRCILLIGLEIVLVYSASFLNSVALIWVICLVLLSSLNVNTTLDIMVRS